MAVTVAQVDITSPNITESSVSNFVSGLTSKRHEGFVPDGQTSLIAEYNLTAASGKYLASIGPSSKGVEVIYAVRTANADWEPYYSWTVTDTFYTSSGNTGYVSSSNVKIFYTPPDGVFGLDPDPVSPEGDFSSHLHDIRFSYEERDIFSIPNKITSVNLSKSFVGASSENQINVGANSIGNATLSVRKLNTAKTDYTHSYNFSNNTWVAKASGLQNKTITFTAETVKSGEYCYVETTSDNESKSYSVVLAAGTLALDASIPDAINELNFETVQQVRATFNPATKTAVTVSAGITTAYKGEMQGTKIKYPFSFVYTKASGTLTLDRQPLRKDVTGHDQMVTVTGEVASGSGTIIASDTTGVKVGMYLKDGNFETGLTGQNRIPVGTEVATLSSNTNFTMKNSIGTAVATQAVIDGEGQQKIQLTSDWLYEFEDMAAVINEGATAVTVTGNLRILQYGRSAPDGNILLQPNFLTIS